MPRPTDPHAPLRPDWKEAAADFVSARVELFSLEARDASVVAVKKAIAAGITAVAAVCCWICLLVGVIGWIAAASGLAWYWVTLMAAGVLLLVAGIAAFILTRPAAQAAFPLTRNEFAKDRAWLRTLKDQPKR